MKYVLDTDIFSYISKGYNQKLLRKVNEIDSANLFTTVINYAEILRWLNESDRNSNKFIIIKNFLERLPLLYLDKKSAEIFAIEKPRLKKAGEIVENLDLLIASICIANDCTLITNNTRHFDRILGLKIENWNI